LGVIFGAAAAAISLWNGQTALLCVSVIAAFGAFWVDRQCRMGAFAAARQRPDFDGTFVDADLENVPGHWTALTFVLVAVCLILAGVSVAQAL
jgi:hypothetical protein